jgi:hypothetical protein
MPLIREEKLRRATALPPPSQFRISRAAIQQVVD